MRSGRDGAGTKKGSPTQLSNSRKSGGYLLSHWCAVPSAIAGLTSLFGMGRGGTPLPQPPEYPQVIDIGGRNKQYETLQGKVYRAISIARLWCRHLYTCDLSTSYSSTTLKGDLILRLASCLDAFSTYPFPTQLPSNAPGGTTGRPEVSPTRSSRTSVSTAQISYARNRQRPNCLTTF